MQECTEGYNPMMCGIYEIPNFEFHDCLRNKDYHRSSTKSRNFHDLRNETTERNILSRYIILSLKFAFPS